MRPPDQLPMSPCCSKYGDAGNPRSSEKDPAQGNGALVDINTASVDELANVVGLGRAAAEAIVAARELQGGFSCVKDLFAVPGVDAALLQEMRFCMSCSRKEDFGNDSTWSRWTPEDGSAIESASDEIRLAQWNDDVLWDINTASIDDLVEIAGLERATAEAIVTARMLKKDFCCVEDLLTVPGVDETLLHQICFSLKSCRQEDDDTNWNRWIPDDGCARESTPDEERPAQWSDEFLWDINSASIDDLVEVAGLERATAEAIVTERMLMRDFSCVEDLLMVPGVDAALLQQICFGLSCNRKENGVTTRSRWIHSASETARKNASLNLNTASVDDLVEVALLPRADAELIVEARTRLGGFSREDLLELLGVDPNPNVHAKPSFVRSLKEYFEDDSSWSRWIPEDGNAVGSTCSHLPTCSHGSTVPAEENDALVDINTASVSELAEIAGLERAAADMIVAARWLRGGFCCVKDLLTVPGIDAALLKEIQLYLSCSPIEDFNEETDWDRWISDDTSEDISEDGYAFQPMYASDKDLVDINIASVDDLAEATGLGRVAAEAIVATRMLKGNFSCVEDLATVPGVDACLLTYRLICRQKEGIDDEFSWSSWITEDADAGGSTSAEGPAQKSHALVDINTASVEDLAVVAGLGSLAAEAIVEDRRLKGDFNCVEDLLSVPGIDESLLTSCLTCIRKEDDDFPWNRWHSEDTYEDVAEYEDVGDPTYAWDEDLVDINIASVDDLAEAAGLGRMAAEAIVATRMLKGNFSCVEDLLTVPEVDARLLTYRLTCRHKEGINDDFPWSRWIPGDRDAGGSTSAEGPAQKSHALVDINTASVEDLAVVAGLGRVAAEAIVEDRRLKGDFNCVEDLLSVPGIDESLLTSCLTCIRKEDDDFPWSRWHSEDTFEDVAEDEDAGDPTYAWDKDLVDINIASVDDLAEAAGLGRVAAEAIVATRNLKGNFSCVEDLLTVPEVDARLLTYRLICRHKEGIDDDFSCSRWISEDTSEDIAEDEDAGKPTHAWDKDLVDINIASVDDLAEATGLGRVAAEAIVATRNLKGNFSCVEDLATVPGVDACLLTYRLICRQKEGIDDDFPCSRCSSEAADVGRPMSAEEGSAEVNDAVVDINTSSVDDLAKVVGLGRAAAEAIVAARRLQGGFSRVGDLVTVPGIDAALLQELACCLHCSPRENFSDDTQGTRWGSASSSSCGSREELAASAASSEAEATSLASSVNRLLQSEGLPSSDDEEGSCSSTEGMAEGEDDPTAAATAGVQLKRKREVAQRLGGKKPCGWETSYSSSSEGSATPTVTEDRPNAAPAPRRTRHPSTLVQPPKLDAWLDIFQSWSHSEQLYALDQLIEGCEPGQVRHMMNVIEPQFQRDFISLLPKELALYVLTFLEPRDLLRAAQTCHYWRILAEDNLLWREKCREAGLEDVQEVLGRRVATCTSSSPPSPNSATPIPWKLAFMRHHYVEMNWRCKPIREPKVLRGHEDHVITCLQFSGNRIVSGSDDNTLKVWSATSGRCLRTLIGHTGGVWSSQMAGSVVVSGSTDRTLRVWNADTGMCLHTLYGHTSTVRCMHLYGNKVVSGSRDATLRVWDLETGECLHVLVGHVAAVRCVQYNGRLVVSGAYDYMVKVWDPRREECLHTLQGHTNRVYSLQFDGVHVVSGSLDTSIRVWDVETGACRHQLMGHQSLTSGMELRNNILVSGNADSTVKVWDILTGQCLQTLAGAHKHQSAVTCLQFNSKFVVTSSDDGTVKLWDLRTGEFLRNLVALESGGSGGVVWRLRASSTKLVCAVGSRNGTEETKLLVLDFDEPK